MYANFLDIESNNLYLEYKYYFSIDFETSRLY